MNRAKKMVALALLSVFALGFGAGTLTAHTWAKRAIRRAFVRPADPLEEQVILRALQRRVGLDDQQLALARQLLYNDRPEIVAIRRKAIEQTLAVRQRSQAALMPHLSPEQQARLERLSAEYRSRQMDLVQELDAAAQQAY
jgi:protein-disulfide isomerase-like protein with CxxC motif